MSRKAIASQECHERIGVRLGLLLASSLGSTLLTGCIAIGGSSRGGFFIWPGGLGLLVMILLVVLLLRRR